MTKETTQSLLNYIIEYYSLPKDIGLNSVVKYKGNEGKIINATETAHFKVLFDDGYSGYFHPLDLEYQRCLTTMKKNQVQFRLTDDTKDTLEKLAETLGFTYNGRGSISYMLEAVASEKYLIVKNFTIQD